MGHSDKTEKATPKRRKEARQKGQVAKSSDFNGAIVLVAGTVAVVAMGPAVVSGTGNFMHSAFAQIANPNAALTAAGLNGIFQLVLTTMLGTVAPIAAVCAATALLSNVAQIGFRPSIAALKPDVKRINPAAGFKNLFGPRLLFETGKNLAKVGSVGAVAAMALIPQLTNLGASVGTTPSALGQLMKAGALGIVERAAIAYLVIGVIDLVYQRRRHNKALKMTKQEVKDEFKHHSLPPEVRSAQRRRQRQMARARMMAAVPEADVVVTNPTHYAVALSYSGDHPAPVVVAKGQDNVAFQIRRLAEENGVPVVPDPPTARALHASVEINQMIPEELFAAVAQVLAHVYRLAARRKVAV
jgi:flagellar biosynthetic protein FlhB